MRTAVPENIRLDFAKGVEDIESALLDIGGKGLRQQTRIHMVEFSYLAASILLEGFLNDLFVAYINRRPEAFVAYLTSKMTIETKDELAKRAATHATIDIQKHLTMDKIRKIIDPHEFNLTFQTTADLKHSAGVWLDPTYKAYFLSISKQHGALLEATKAVRNYLAHRSNSSQKRMQTALHNVDLPASFKRGTNKINSVGSFLDSAPKVGAPTRLTSYLSEIKIIAQHLCP